MNAITARPSIMPMLMDSPKQAVSQRDVRVRRVPAILQIVRRNLLSSIVCAPDSFEFNPGTQGTSLPSRKRQGGRSLPEFSSSGGNAHGRAGTRRAGTLATERRVPGEVGQGIPLPAGDPHSLSREVGDRTRGGPDAVAVSAVVRSASCPARPRTHTAAT